jgi:long-chain acyl-CoA synthetase
MARPVNVSRADALGRSSSTASLASLLFTSHSDPNALAIAVGYDERSWHALEARAEEFAVALRATGAPVGTAVAVMLPNGIDLVAALFGVWRAGAVYVPINPRLTDTEVTKSLGMIDPALVIVLETASHRVAGRPSLVIDETAITVVPSKLEPAVQASFAPEAALVQFTSGTTGPPKPVVLTHSGVLDLIDGVLAALRPDGSKDRSKDRLRPIIPNIIPMSLSLWAGIYNVLFAFRTGAPVVLMEKFETLEFARLIRRFDIRSSVLPPAAIAALISDSRIDSLAPLRYVRSVTAPLPPLRARQFKERFGISVLNGYGQTEIGGEIVGWTAADSRLFGETKLGSVGRPHAGVELMVDPSSGELLVRTPALEAANLDGSDLSDRFVGDGWFRTGDVGRMDDDGFVWIDGRLSDMINRGGLKIQPSEVEEVLMLSPLVADAAVVGMADERLGEVPIAFVVPSNPDLSPSAEWLERYCREHLAAYKIPVHFKLISSLPRNEIGKVMRHLLAVPSPDGRSPTSLNHE